MLILGLETSTSSAKAILFDSEKGILAKRTTSFSPTISANGMSDTYQIYRNLMETAYPISDGKDIDAIALCGTWQSIATIDQDMQPVSPMYAWNYLEPQQSTKKIRANEELTNELYQRTGCVPHVTYPRHALLYHKEQGMDFSDKKFISQGAFNFYKLTDTWCESKSTMSGSGLLNIHSLEYDDVVLDMLGTSKEQFPPLVTAQDYQPLTPNGADKLGISPGIPVMPAYPDGALNQYGACYGRLNEMSISIGTSGAIRLSVDHPVLLEGMPLWCYYGVNNWIAGGAISGAGNCINWFMNNVNENHKSFGDFAADTDLNKTYPLFLPFLFGERCPGWHDGRKGGFYDLLGYHTLHDMYKSVQMGILFNLYQCFEKIVSINGLPDYINVSGGILNSINWTQMLADMFQVPFDCSTIHDSSLFGAVLLAANILTNGEIDVKELTGKNRQEVKPRPEYRDFYMKQYERYLDLYNSKSRLFT